MDSDLDMTFKNFVECYTKDMRVHIKNTWITKEQIVESRLMVYLGRMKMCNIAARQIICLQKEMMNYNGKRYFLVYLKTIHS